VQQGPVRVVHRQATRDLGLAPHHGGESGFLCRRHRLHEDPSTVGKHTGRRERRAVAAAPADSFDDRTAERAFYVGAQVVGQLVPPKPVITRGHDAIVPDCGRAAARFTGSSETAK